VLEEANRRVEAWGGSLLFAYLPLHSSTGEMADDPHRDAVLDITRRLGIRSLDLGPAIEAKRSASLFACADCHFSPAGYRVLADALSQAIAESPAR
jgi:hypothetical protein